MSSIEAIVGIVVCIYAIVLTVVYIKVTIETNKDNKHKKPTSYKWL